MSAKNWQKYALELQAKVKELEGQLVEAGRQITRLEDRQGRILRRKRILRGVLESCWHIANCYDGNHAKACDDITSLVSVALKK
jgi:hypothetical protein